MSCSEQVRKMRFQVLTAASMKVAVFWVVVPCTDDAGSKHLWNVDNLLSDYTAQQPRRQQSKYERYFLTRYLDRNMESIKGLIYRRGNIRWGLPTSLLGGDSWKSLFTVEKS
jgi:hypothetical protein